MSNTDQVQKLCERVMNFQVKYLSQIEIALIKQKIHQTTLSPYLQRVVLGRIKNYLFNRKKMEFLDNYYKQKAKKEKQKQKHDQQIIVKLAQSTQNTQHKKEDRKQKTINKQPQTEPTINIQEQTGPSWKNIITNKVKAFFKYYQTPQKQEGEPQEEKLSLLSSKTTHQRMNYRAMKEQ